MRRKGEITIGAVVGVIAIIGSVLGFSGYFNSRIEATNTEVGEIKGDIRVLNTKLDFLLGKDGVIFNPETGKVEPVKKVKTTLNE